VWKKANCAEVGPVLRVGSFCVPATYEGSREDASTMGQQIPLLDIIGGVGDLRYQS